MRKSAARVTGTSFAHDDGEGMEPGCMRSR